MAFTIGEYLCKETLGKGHDVALNVTNLVILEGQVARAAKGRTQLLQLEASLDVAVKSISIKLYNVSDNGVRAPEAYGSCCVTLEDANS